MKRKLSLLLAGAMLLTGCASNVGAESASVSDTAPENIGSAADKTATAERKEDIVLTMACFTEPEETMQELIDSFNAEDNGVKIEVKSFASNIEPDGMPHGFTDEELTKLDFDVTQELINKDTIDLVGTFSFGNGAKFEIFKRKGGFVDLNKFMENDPEINSDTLNSHILDLCEHDGKLYSIPTHYYAMTMLSKAEYGGTTRNWTIDEFIDHWNAMPEGSTVNYSTVSEGIYYDVLRENTPAFIDYKNCEVHFDAPDFRKMLEFCHSFDSNMGRKSDDYINTSHPMLVENCPLTGYQNSIRADIDYANNTITYSRLRDGKYTLVGYPTSDRNGAFLCGINECAIRSNISEEKQQAAWKFLREFYMEDYQTEHYAMRDEITTPEGTVVQFGFIDGFPINNAARKRIAQNVINGEYLSSYEKEGTIRINGDEPATLINSCQPDQADIDYIDDYMNSIERWEFPYADRELFWIVEEEVLTYLQGEQDIDKTIDLIQNRASIWISEQA